MQFSTPQYCRCLVPSRLSCFEYCLGKSKATVAQQRRGSRLSNKLRLDTRQKLPLLSKSTLSWKHNLNSLIPIRGIAHTSRIIVGMTNRWAQEYYFDAHYILNSTTDTRFVFQHGLCSSRSGYTRQHLTKYHQLYFFIESILITLT